MQVSLIQYDKDALELLLLTKQTRLTMSPGLLEEVKAWPFDRKMKELDYMRGTIQSSWEFISYTFLVDGVSRAFTHQFVRSRQGSYAQQSQRTVDMSGFDYVSTGVMAEDGKPHLNNTKDEDWEPWNRRDEMFRYAMISANNWYEKLIESEVPPQDARGVLPTNVATNIVAKFNLRTLADMAKIRLCYRTQGEYQEVFRAMRDEVIKVHPWADPFIRVHCAAVGTCAFPNFKECPIKGGVFNADTGRRWDEAKNVVHICNDDIAFPTVVERSLPPVTRDEQQRAWEGIRFEAIPAQGKAT